MWGSAVDIGRGTHGKMSTHHSTYIRSWQGSFIRSRAGAKMRDLYPVVQFRHGDANLAYYGLPYTATDLGTIQPFLFAGAVVGGIAHAYGFPVPWGYSGAGGANGITLWGYGLGTPGNPQLYGGSALNSDGTVIAPAWNEPAANDWDNLAQTQASPGAGELVSYVDSRVWGAITGSTSIGIGGTNYNLGLFRGQAKVLPAAPVVLGSAQPVQTLVGQSPPVYYFVVNITSTGPIGGPWTSASSFVSDGYAEIGALIESPMPAMITGSGQQNINVVVFATATIPTFSTYQAYLGY